MISRHLLMSAVLSGIWSMPVSAYSQGQTSYSGRDRSCLSCHGTKQYDGMKFRIATEDTFPCDVADGDPVNLPLLKAGRTYAAVVEIAAPSGADAPSCPTENCCDPGTGENFPPPSEATCMVRGGCTAENANACCTPGLNICEGASAGFNAEVVGGGTFIADTGTRLAYLGDETLGNEITHDFPKSVTAGGSWTFQYTAPATGDATSALEFWVGANVANGNGIEDPEDLNSNYLVYAALEDDDGNVQVPDFCLVCPDGSPASGGCCCNSQGQPGGGTPATFASLSVLSLLGALLVGRRRRR